MCHHCATLATNSRNDPTNTAGLRRKAFADIRKRLNGAYRDVRDLIESLPYTTIDVPQDQIRNLRVYKYDLTDRDTDAEIWRIIEEWFETGGDPPNRWVLGQFVSEAYRSGTGHAAERLRSLAEQAQALSLVELGQLQAEAVLMSRPVRARIDKVYRRMFEEMVGFTGDTANDLARTLANGVARGAGVKTITGDIKRRFGVAESRAQRIARTELGQSYRDARREMDVDARDRLGLNVMQQWISALAPTTRASHAARHLNFYTPEETAAFYSRDGNSIQCLCSQQAVLLTQDNKILGERKWTKRDKQEVEELTKKAA